MEREYGTVLPSRDLSNLQRDQSPVHCQQKAGRTQSLRKGQGLELRIVLEQTFRLEPADRSRGRRG